MHLFKRKPTLGEGCQGAASRVGHTEMGSCLYHLLCPSSGVRMGIWGVRRWAVEVGYFESQPTKGLNWGGVIHWQCKAQSQHSTSSSNSAKVPSPQEHTGTDDISKVLFL